MSLLGSFDHKLAAVARPLFGSSAVRFVACLGLCAAYLQGGLVKLTDFQGAIGEMAHFGLSPAAPLAALVILFELGASVMILSGWLRWLGALGLGGSRCWPPQSRCASGRCQPDTIASWPPTRSSNISGWSVGSC